MSMSELTPERLAEIKARAEKATPGPWTATYEESDQWTSITGAGLFDGGHWMVCPEVATTEGEPGEDSDFIAHAREDVPDLMAEVERLQRERDNALRHVDAAVIAQNKERFMKRDAEADAARLLSTVDRLSTELNDALNDVRGYKEAAENVGRERDVAEAERDALQAKLDQVRAWTQERSLLTESGRLVSGVPGLQAILDGKGQDDD
jgi:chromosome segregation ATPase